MRKETKQKDDLSRFARLLLGKQRPGILSGYEFLGHYGAFPAYMYSLDILKRCSWVEYRALLFFYGKTLGASGYWRSNPFTVKDLTKVGLSDSQFSKVKKSLLKKCLLTQNNYLDAKADPIFHLQSWDTPRKKRGNKQEPSVKKYVVTFLAPHLELSETNTFQKDMFRFWYVGNGRGGCVTHKSHRNCSQLQAWELIDLTEGKAIRKESFAEIATIQDPDDPTFMIYSFGKSLCQEGHFYFFLINYF